jgi:hypothetical protein
MQTFLDAMPMTKEKMIAPNSNGHQNLIAQPGTACQIEFRLIHVKQATDLLHRADGQLRAALAHIGKPGPEPAHLSGLTIS